MEENNATVRKIAIVGCLKSNQGCAGCACLNAFNHREKAFEVYKDMPVELVAFMRCSNCCEEIDPLDDPGFIKKVNRMVEEGIDTVHIGICAVRQHDGIREDCPGMLKMIDAFKARGIKVVRGTH